MSVVSQSHFELVRARKSLEKAFEKRDWPALRNWDTTLGECLNRAFDDDSRNTIELVQEMEKVLQTYAHMLAAIPDNESDCLSSFPYNIT